MISRQRPRSFRYKIMSSQQRLGSIIAWIPAFAGMTMALILNLTSPAIADTQFNATVTPNSGPIGSQFTYTISAVSDAKTDWKSVQFQPKWSPFLSIKQTFKSYPQNGKEIGVWTITLTHFETHSVVIPTQSISVAGSVQTLPSFSIGYQAPTGNSKLAFQPAPLRTLPTPWLPIFGILILLTAFIAVLAWVIHRFRNRQIESISAEPEPEITTDPEADAWDAIAQLPIALPEDDIDPIYTSIADILRKYLGAKFKTHLFERTTSEIVTIMTPYLEEQSLRRVRNVLRDCDGVKFGKRLPNNADYVQTVERLKQIVAKLGAGHDSR